MPQINRRFNQRESLPNVAPGGPWKYVNGRSRGNSYTLLGQVIFCARCRSNLWVIDADSIVLTLYAWRVVKFPGECYCKRCAQIIDNAASSRTKP
jgi:hypothetical protein